MTAASPKLLATLVALLLFMCLALLWWIAALLPAVRPLALAVTLLFMATAAIALVVRRLRARKAAHGIEAGLLAQARAQHRSLRPDLQPETTQLQQDFERAVKALKSSRIGRSGRDALYYLPWYAIIGPSGAGKSTALRNSGLRFPNVMHGDDVKVKGIGGTRNCDFWLSNDAVLLDTAGRWSTETEDKEEWLGFLRLLQKHRSRKPLNGLIAAISIGDIVNGGAEQVEALAMKMRERIDEVLSELRLSLPVYILFTKCDLLDGFVDTFGGLHASEREQVWGFTLPLAGSAPEPERSFERELELLDQKLHAAALCRLGQESQLAARQRIFEFPQQFSAARTALQRFVSVLFHRSVYHEPASLRGVYFSSGTQEGRPFSLLQGSLLPAERRVDQKSYFLRGLFLDVIFGDSEIAAASPSELRKRRIVRFAALAGLAVATIALLIVPTWAFVSESSRLASSGALAETWHQRFMASDDSAVHAEPHELEPVLDDLRSYEDDAPGWFATLGMSAVGRVLPAVRTHHHALMQRWVVRPLASADVPTMDTFGLRFSKQTDSLPSAKEHKQAYDMLKQHLLLSARQLKAEDAAWLTQYLGSRLREKEPQPDAARRVAESFVRLIPDQRVPTMTVHSDTVQRAREALTRSSIAQHALDMLVAELEPQGYDLTLATILGRSRFVRGTKVVRGAFTRRGWEEKARARLPELAKTQVAELWVLGLSQDSSAAKQAMAGLAELDKLYQRSYVEEWSAFLQDIHVQAPADTPDALSLLTELTSGRPTPYGRLFKALDDNSRLELSARESSPVSDLKKPLEKLFGRSAPESAASAAPEVPIAPSVRAALEPVFGFGVPPAPQPGAANTSPPTVPYDEYVEQLQYVRDALQSQLNTPGEQRSPDARLQTAQARVRALIDVQEPIWRPVFNALLWPPLQAAAASWSGDEARRTSARWCNEVSGPFDRALRGRYPFVRGGADASLDDFDAFYRPVDGSLWGFVSGGLQGVVAREGPAFKFVPRLGGESAAAYSQSLLRFLEQTQRITSAFYPLGSKAPSVTLQVRIKPTPWIARTTLSVGGKSVEYRTGPEIWQEISWPGPQPMQGASFELSGANLAGNQQEEAGVWGLMRLLERGKVVRESDQTFRVEWPAELHQGHYQVVIEFRPSRADAPFFAPSAAGFMGLLRQPTVAPPAQLTAAKQPCGG